MMDRSGGSISYLASAIEARPIPEKGGRGIFARAHIPAGTLLCLFGGDVLTHAELQTSSELEQRYSIQIGDDQFMVSRLPAGPADFVNHSCDPNAGIEGQIGLVAMRDIAADEEICFDYAMSDSLPYDEFTCGCGTPTCRGTITGNDWQLPELQQRYAGYFSLYLQRRIAALTTAH